MSRSFAKALIPGAFAIIASIAVGCDSDDNNNNNQVSILDQTITALGGLDALQAVESIAIEASGENFDPGQGVTPEQASKTSGYQSTHIVDMDQQSIRTQWQLSTQYFFPPRSFEYAEVSQRDFGFVDGIDGHIVVDAQSPMLSTRVETIKKQERLANPVALLLTGAKNPAIFKDQGERTEDGTTYAVLTVSDGLQPIDIFIDPATKLPVKVTTLEDDPVFGDALVEVAYADWRKVDDIMQPFSLTYRLAGSTYLTEKRGAITLNPPAVDYAVPAALQVPRDAALAEWGELGQAYFRRWHGIGLPFYFPQGQAMSTEVAPGVYWLTGGSHHSMVIEMSDHLILAEAPLYELRSRALQTTIATLFPNKPIRYVVATHHHHDHIGGARTFVADGATLVIPEAIKGFVDEMLAEPHTVVPDALQGKTVTPNIMTVTDTLVLDDGVRTVEIRNMPTDHAGGMLAVWLPGEKIMFVSDMYSPGIAPPGQQAAGEQLMVANELVDFVEAKNLPVETFVGGHGLQLGTLPELRTLAGRN